MHREFLSILPVFSSLEAQTRNERAIGRKRPSLDRFIWPKHVRQRSLVSSFIFLAAVSLSAK